MFNFIRDMVIGWIIYTDAGKKVANKIVTYTYQQVKSNIMQSSQIKNIVNELGLDKNAKSNDNKSKD